MGEMCVIVCGDAVAENDNLIADRYARYVRHIDDGEVHGDATDDWRALTVGFSGSSLLSLAWLPPQTNW